MNYPHLSIRTRIILLYMTLLTGVYCAFSAYIYFDLSRFLQRGLEQALSRRATQIAVAMEQYTPANRIQIGVEIQVRYSPELNERVIQITDEQNHPLYASKNVDLLGNDSFTTANAFSTPAYLRAQLTKSFPDHQYMIEVAGPTSEISVALSNLLATLAYGFPPLCLIAISGGYLLLGRALHPIDEIISAAEIISTQNLSGRLPVPQSRDEFQRMSQALNRMIERLQEAYLVSSRFAADASHQLRTPLTIMRGELETLIREVRSQDEILDCLGSVLEESERLTRIVEGLLFISRLEVGEAKMNREALDLAKLVDSTIDQMLLLAEEKNISVERHLEPTALVHADPVRIRQAVINLLDNALKYTPEKGCIQIRVFVSSTNAILEVEDSGVGIAPEAIPMVFQRFYRAPETATTPGSGLGLAIAESIVQAHSGSLSLKSTVGKGSCFTIRIPLFHK